MTHNQSESDGAAGFTRPLALLLSGLLVLAAICSDGRNALAQTPLDCSLPAGVPPPADPRVTAHEVEDGSASLRDFALAATEYTTTPLQGRMAGEQAAYLSCLTRQEGGPWRSGSTYLVELTPDGRVWIHTKDMALSGRQLTPVIYSAILEAVGISPAVLTDPAASQAAFAAASAGEGGPFDVPSIPGASGYATVYLTAGWPHLLVLLAGFDLSASHVVPLSEEALDYGAPPITARDVVDRATLKAFVTAAAEYVISILDSGDAAALAQARLAMRDPTGPWRHGPVYLAAMFHFSKTIIFHGAFPDRFELRRGGISRDAVTGELVVDQLIAAAESGPEGGFWQYHFDNPADDTDRADIPKVGYARVFTAHIPLADGRSPPIDFIINSGFYLSSERLGDLGGQLENPGPHAFQSGIGALWGWVCEAEQVEIEIGTEQGDFAWHMAAYGLERLDTLESCGDTDNGFVLLLNWNLLGDGQHTVTALVDGVELGQTTVTVTTLGEEFVVGAVGECVAEDFPDLGQAVTLEWRQNSQNFVITDVE